MRVLLQQRAPSSDSNNDLKKTGEARDTKHKRQRRLVLEAVAIIRDRDSVESFVELLRYIEKRSDQGNVEKIYNL